MIKQQIYSHSIIMGLDDDLGIIATATPLLSLGLFSTNLRYVFITSQGKKQQ